jgi:hypothetical protein
MFKAFFFKVQSFPLTFPAPRGILSGLRLSSFVFALTV